MAIDGKLLYLKIRKGEANSTYSKLKSRFDKLANINISKAKYIIEDSKTTTNVEKKKQPYNKDMNAIIETIFKDGLVKALMVSASIVSNKLLEIRY